MERAVGKATTPGCSDASLLTSSISMLWKATPLAMEAYSGSTRYGVPTTADGPERPSRCSASTTARAESVVEPLRVTAAKSRQRYLAQSITSGDKSSYSRDWAKLPSARVIPFSLLVCTIAAGLLWFRLLLLYSMQDLVSSK